MSLCDPDYAADYDQDYATGVDLLCDLYPDDRGLTSGELLHSLLYSMRLYKALVPVCRQVFLLLHVNNQ